LDDFDRKKGMILDRVDIVDVVSEHVALKRAGRRWVGLCPFHTEKTPSFTVSPERSLFKCFGCGRGGDVFTFVQLSENVPFIEAMRMLADRAGVELGPSRGQGQQGPDRADIARANDWAMRFFRSIFLDESGGASARAYVASRGFTEETVQRFNVGLTPGEGRSLENAAKKAGLAEPLLIAADLLRHSEDGRSYETFRNRLMFPIRDVTNRVVGFGGRTLGDDRAKYLNTRQNALFDKGRGLYGLDLARKRVTEVNRAVLVEGYTDCMAAHQAGFTETVATLGTALTEHQVELLRRYCEEIIVLFDSDRAGEEAADRAITVALPRHVSIRLARLPDGKDPSAFLGSHPASAFSEVLKSAVDALEFKWSRLQLEYASGESDRKRREAVLDFVRLVAQACGTGSVDVIQRGLISNRLAKLLQLDSLEVNELIIRFQRKRRSRPVEAARDVLGTNRRIPVDSEQLALTHVLEVLLNEPGLVSAVDPFPDVTRIADLRCRRIAGHVQNLARTVGEFRLDDVLACCHEPEDAAHATDLAQRGAARGNYEATLKLAVERIGRFARDRTREQARQALTEGNSSKQDSKERNAHLRMIHERLKERSHYAPARKMRGRPTASTADDEGSF
jgi:DNA primase